MKYDDCLKEKVWTKNIQCFCPHLFAGEKDNKYYSDITSCTGKQKILESCKLIDIEKQVIFMEGTR